MPQAAVAKLNTLEKECPGGRCASLLEEVGKGSLAVLAQAERSHWDLYLHIIFGGVRSIPRFYYLPENVVGNRVKFTENAFFSNMSIDFSYVYLF